MTLLNVTYCENSEYESDLCSNEHHLSCGENVAYAGFENFLGFGTFFGPSLHYCLSSVHHCEGRAHIHTIGYFMAILR